MGTPVQSGLLTPNWVRGAVSASRLPPAPFFLRDPLDDRNIMLEIRGGAGGDEASIWAGDLYRMYLRYAQVCELPQVAEMSLHP